MKRKQILAGMISLSVAATCFLGPVTTVAINDETSTGLEDKAAAQPQEAVEAEFYIPQKLSLGKTNTITWNGGIKDIYGYSVERSTSPDSGFGWLETVLPNEVPEFEDLGNYGGVVDGATYYYRVRPITLTNGVVSYVGSSNVVSLKYEFLYPQKVEKSGKYTIKWTGGIASEKLYGYQVARSETPNGYYQWQATILQENILEHGGKCEFDVRKAHYGYEDGKTYYYQITPFTRYDDGKGYARNFVLPESDVLPMGGYAQKVSLAKDGDKEKKNTITWKGDAPDNLYGYSVERSTSPDSGFTWLETVVPDEKQEFEDLGNYGGAVDGATYYYRVRPITLTNGVVSYVGSSNVVSLKYEFLYPQKVEKSGKYTIKWTGGIASEKLYGYQVARSETPNGYYQWQATILQKDILEDGGKCEFDVRDAYYGYEDGKTYYYQITPFTRYDDKKGYARNFALPESNVLSFTCTDEKLETPVVKTSTTVDTATVSWDKVAGANTYDVFRAESEDGEYKKIGGVAANETTFTDKGLSWGNTYYYKVQAMEITADKVAKSDFGAAAATPQPEPQKLGVDKSVLTWDGNVPDVYGYAITRSTSKDGEYSWVKTEKYRCRFADSGLIRGKTYYYKVTPIKMENGKTLYGPESEPIGIKHFEELSTGIIADIETMRSGTALRRNYIYARNYDTREATVEVYASDREDGEYVQVTKKDQSGVFIHDKLNWEKVYYYKIRSVLEVDGERLVSDFTEAMKSDEGLIETPEQLFLDTEKKDTLKWIRVEAASGYELYRARSEDGEFTYDKTINELRTERGRVVDTFSVSDEVSNELGWGESFFYKLRTYCLDPDGTKHYSEFTNVQEVKKRETAVVERAELIAPDEVKIEVPGYKDLDAIAVYLDRFVTNNMGDLNRDLKEVKVNIFPTSAIKDATIKWEVIDEESGKVDCMRQLAMEDEMVNGEVYDHDVVKEEFYQNDVDYGVGLRRLTRHDYWRERTNEGFVHYLQPVIKDEFLESENEADWNLNWKVPLVNQQKYKIFRVTVNEGRKDEHVLEKRILSETKTPILDIGIEDIGSEDTHSGYYEDEIVIDEAKYGVHGRYIFNSHLKMKFLDGSINDLNLGRTPFYTEYEGVRWKSRNIDIIYPRDLLDRFTNELFIRKPGITYLDGYYDGHLNGGKTVKRTIKVTVINSEKGIYPTEG
ncbi:MAG: hypothetical protein RR626_06295 [Anaerovoracaceae bacterium]